jgi:hypothetical protein
MMIFVLSGFFSLQNEVFEVGSKERFVISFVLDVHLIDFANAQEDVILDVTCVVGDKGGYALYTVRYSSVVKLSKMR